LLFPEVEKDSLFTSELAETLHFKNIALSADADSLGLTVWLISKDAGALRQNAALPLQAAFTLNSAPIVLNTIPASGKLKQNLRVVIPVQALRGQMVSLQPVLTNLDVNKSLGALIHVYEADAANAGKHSTPAAVIVAAIPQPLSLRVYPNPFNPSTQIHFTMKEAGLAKLRLYNLNGQLIRELLTESRIAGEHTLLWDGRDARGVTAASGVYFIRFEAGHEVKVSKIMLIR
jgi:hypothetical protein